MIIIGQKEKVGDWVASQMNYLSPWFSYEAIGLSRNDELIAGVVIENYIKDTRCSVHCAGVGGHWLNREFLRTVFNYVFLQLKCNVIINVVDASNIQSVKFTGHLGFNEMCRIPNGSSDGSDSVIFAMQKTDCRWILKEIINNG